MTGFEWKRAGVFFAAATALMPAAGVAQSNGAAPQSVPNVPFTLPSTRPTPAPTPTSGPVVAPLPTPTPRATPTPTPTPSSTPTAATTPVSRPTPRPTPTASPSPSPTASATPVDDASPAATPPAPTPTATPAPSSAPPLADTTPASGWIAIGVALVALAAAIWFLFRRPKRRTEAEPEAFVLDQVVPPPPEPAASPTAAEPSPFLTVPMRPRRSVDTGEPKLEIVLSPKRAGTNLTSAAVDYRLAIRNTGGIAVRDVRVAMYMLSASARQAQDLQMVFATAVDQPMTPPFDIAVGGEVELSGMALLDRDRVNVMTIEERPWFVPVLAVKAEYRWGDNVGAPGVATAAEMIGIDRGEGAKMSPFRLDGPPQMHPRVASRKVA